MLFFAMSLIATYLGKGEVRSLNGYSFITSNITITISIPKTNILSNILLLFLLALSLKQILQVLVWRRNALRISLALLYHIHLSLFLFRGSWFDRRILFCLIQALPIAQFTLLLLNVPKVVFILFLKSFISFIELYCSLNIIWESDKSLLFWNSVHAWLDNLIIKEGILCMMETDNQCQ